MAIAQKWETSDQNAVTLAEALVSSTAGEISDGAAVHPHHSNINNVLSANL